MPTMLSQLYSTDPTSFIIACIFCFITFTIAVLGFWPLNKIFGFFSLVAFWRETKKIKKRLKEAIQKLPDKDHRKAFAQRYEDEINPYFSKEDSLFTHLWIEFTEQLVKPSKEEPDFQNSIRPEKFFTFDALLKKANINFKLVESMPGILVGLGVLGTFVGLSVSIIRVLPHLKDNKLDTAVDLLISGAGVAFFTSVVGLTCSLIFNFISDKRTSLLQSLLTKFNFRLEKSLKFITEEHLLSEQMKQQSKYLENKEHLLSEQMKQQSKYLENKEHLLSEQMKQQSKYLENKERLLSEHLKEMKQQSKCLENMNENIALKIGDKIEASLQTMGGKIHGAISQGNQNISEQFLEKISHKMNEGIGGFANTQRENLEKTLSAIQNNIPPLIERLEQSQKQNEEITKSLINQMTASNMESQQKINQSLAESIKQMKSEFSEITQNLKESMSQTLTDSSGELKTLMSNLGSINKDILEKTNQSQSIYKEHFDKTAKNLHSFTDRLEKAVSEINTITTDSIRPAIEQFNQVVEQQTQITQENKQYIDSLNQLSGTLKSISFSISDMTNKMPEYIQLINHSNEYLKAIWGKYESRFEAVDEKTAKLFENLKEGLASVAEKSAEHIEKLNQHSAQISNNFAHAVEELKETVEGLTDTVEDLNNKKTSS